MSNHPFEADFSMHRLRGEPLPHDLSLLLAHRDELEHTTGIVFDATPSWSPWLDTSYLSEKDWANPDIRANVKAIADVCTLIDFVIAGEDGTYLGYWRGPQQLPISEAPIVCLDNEGRFNFCGTQNIAGAVLTSLVSFSEHRPWFASIGITALPSGPFDLFDLEMDPSPADMHDALYHDYLAATDRP